MNYHGYDYATVQIGDQCWFAENLRNEHYANGDAIPGELSNDDWLNTTFGAQVIYDNDTENEVLFGRLYNGYAIVDTRNVCPNSWHVPTADDWYELENGLGGSSVAGHSMKSSANDIPPWDGSNESGFFGSAGGLRWENGSFERLNQSGYWWFSDGIHDRRLYGASNALAGTSNDVEMGFSVRCIKDSE